MVSQRALTILNFSLAFIALLLFLNLVGLKLPTLGKAFYVLDKSEPLCIIQWKNEFTPWNDLGRCCLEAKRQLRCHAAAKELAAGKVQWQCATGPSAPSVWLNNKAYYDCRQQPIW